MTEDSVFAGRRFGRLVVSDRIGIDKNRKPLWACVCDCGEPVVVRAGDLRSGNTKSCGCLRVSGDDPAEPRRCRVCYVDIDHLHAVARFCSSTCRVARMRHLMHEYQKRRMRNDPTFWDVMELGGFTVHSAHDRFARSLRIPSSEADWLSSLDEDRKFGAVKPSRTLGPDGPWGGNRWQSDLDRLARRRADFVPVNRRPGYAGVNPADIFARPVPKSLRLSSPFANPWVDNMDKVFLDLDEGEVYDPYMDPYTWREEVGSGWGAAYTDYAYHGSPDIDA